jgi:hypothetical protein
MRSSAINFASRGQSSARMDIAVSSNSHQRRSRASRSRKSDGMKQPAGAGCLLVVAMIGRGFRWCSGVFVRLLCRLRGWRCRYCQPFGRLCEPFGGLRWGLDGLGELVRNGLQPRHYLHQFGLA